MRPILTHGQLMRFISTPGQLMSPILLSDKGASANSSVFFVGPRTTYGVGIGQLMVVVTVRRAENRSSEPHARQ